MSVSNVGGISVNIPDPGFYDTGNLPWGVDPTQTTTGTSGSSSTPSTSSTSTSASAIQNEYNLLNQDDTEELLYASFLTPDQGLANADDVLEQAAALQDEQLSSQQTSLLANAQSVIGGSDSTTASTSTLPTDVSNLPTLSDLLSQSDDAANQVLTSYANGPVGSNILDYQA